ncbi:MAG: AsmA family protein, partial [Bacteroidetes bacterium]|nr:AsmA family protein [Bacteroidota bacterium]
GLDKSINYQMNMDVPAKLLGNEVTKLLSELGPEANDMKINVPVKITGSFNQPQVSLDLNSAVREITDKIVEKQKGKLIDKGKDIIGDFINKNIPQDSTKSSRLPVIPPKDKDSVIKDVENKAKDLLDDLFKGRRNRN